MAKSRNNLLGVGGQRGKLPKPGKSSQTGPADRKAAETQKQELARKMRERLAGQDAQTPSGPATSTTPDTATEKAADQS